MKFDRKRKLKLYEENKEDIFFVGDTVHAINLPIRKIKKATQTKKDSLILGKKKRQAK